MSPDIARSPAPYMQITDHYRRLIHDAELADGDKVPSVASIAKEWNVAHATAAKAISQLQVEGLVMTSPRGTFVAAKDDKATTPRDRLARMRRTGSTASERETHLVNDAEVMTAPTYVAELYGLEHSGQVVRRQWVTVEAGVLRELVVTWHPAEFADQVPELLTRESSNVGPMLSRIEGVSGRVTNARDYQHARGSDAREAAALGLPIGTPILAGTWLAWAGEKLVEYGEYCLPPRHTLTYAYEVPE